MRGRPTKYPGLGKMTNRTVKVPDLIWQRLQTTATMHGCQSVSELLIAIETGELRLVKNISHESLDS